MGAGLWLRAWPSTLDFTPENPLTDRRVSLTHITVLVLAHSCRPRRPPHRVRIATAAAPREIDNATPSCVRFAMFVVARARAVPVGFSAESD